MLKAISRQRIAVAFRTRHIPWSRSASVRATRKMRLNPARSFFRIGNAVEQALAGSVRAPALKRLAVKMRIEAILPRHLHLARAPTRAQ